MFNCNIFRHKVRLNGIFIYIKKSLLFNVHNLHTFSNVYTVQNAKNKFEHQMKHRDCYQWH